MNDSPVIIITGASGGIGAALAHRLASTGAQLVLVARRQHALDDVAAACSNAANATVPMVIAADVTVRADVTRVIRESLERFDHIDVLVNNVGQGITRAPSLLTDDVIAGVIASRQPDVYTRSGAAAQITRYTAALGVDP